MADADEHFLESIVTGKEAWCYLYDTQTKCQLDELKTSSLRKKKICLDKSKGKVMLEVVFFLLQMCNLL